MIRLARILFPLLLLAGVTATVARALGDERVSREPPAWFGAREEVLDAVGAPREGVYAFYVLGDVQMGIGAFRKAVRTASADAEARFAVACGDLVNAHREIVYRLLFAAADDEGSRIPVLTVPGNHDDLEEYVEFLGPLSWHVRAGPDLLIGLDDSRTFPTDEEIDALERLLSTSNARHRFVFLHRPLYREGKSGRRHARLVSVLEEGGVGWVFSGHHHEFVIRDIGSIRECTNGLGGDMAGPLPVPSYVARARVGPDGVTVEKIALGRTVEWAALTTDVLVANLYQPLRERGLWTPAALLLLSLAVAAGWIGHGRRAAPLALFATVIPVWPPGAAVLAGLVLIAAALRVRRWAAGA